MGYIVCFATRILCFFIDFEEYHCWLLCALVDRSSKLLNHIDQVHFVYDNACPVVFIYL
jgi:hypothetical protein